MGELSRVPPRGAASNSREASNLDLVTFVENIRYLKHVASPFIWSSGWIASCYRWDYPHFNLVLLLFSNAFWYQSSSLSLLLLFVLSLGFLSLVGLKTEIFAKSLPDSRPLRPTNAKGEIYQEYYKSIAFVNSLVVNATDYVTSAYRVLRWDDPQASLRSFVGLTTALIILQLSIAFSPMILYNAILLHRLPSYLAPIVKDYYYSKKSAGTDEALEGEKEDAVEEELDQRDGTTQAVPSLQSSATQLGPSKEEDTEIIFSLQAAPSADVVGESESTKEDSSDRVCHGCQSAFGYLWNRRNYCRHCGHHFCGSCCNQHVPRSFFGATAPAAQTETVMVCRRCYGFLSVRLDTQFSPPISGDEGPSQVSKNQPGIN